MNRVNDDFFRNGKVYPLNVSKNLLSRGRVILWLLSWQTPTQYAAHISNFDIVNCFVLFNLFISENSVKHSSYDTDRNNSDKFEVLILEVY